MSQEIECEYYRFGSVRRSFDQLQMRMSACIGDVVNSSNQLQLNANKTEMLHGVCQPDDTVSCLLHQFECVVTM